MENNLIFALISCTIFLIGSVPYVIGIVKGEVLPHVFSWVVWMIAGWINVFILYQTGGGWSLLPAVLNAVFLIGYTISGLLVFRKIPINWFDYLCFVLALATIPIWLYSSHSMAAIATVVIDVLAFLPTFKKSWIQPFSEQAFPWFVNIFFLAFLLLASSEYTFANILYWAYGIALCGSLALLILLRQRYFTKKGVK